MPQRFIRSRTNELGPGTHIHPYAAPRVEHTDHRFHLRTGRSHSAGSHIHPRRCRTARHHQRPMAMAKTARHKIVATAQGKLSHDALRLFE
jgi:hypothetical protein